MVSGVAEPVRQRPANDRWFRSILYLGEDEAAILEGVEIMCVHAFVCVCVCGVYVCGHACSSARVGGKNSLLSQLTSSAPPSRELPSPALPSRDAKNHL